MFPLIPAGFWIGLTLLKDSLSIRAPLCFALTKKFGRRIWRARKEIETAAQELKKIQKQAANNAAVSPVAGRVQDVYSRRGEFVPAGSPVVSVLPPENVKVRFYVPENVFSQIKPGTKVSVYCDGCLPAGIPASVSFVSTRSEFTPPVIYSVESRNKLVFMIEAVFDDKTRNLPPGLPVNVRIDYDERAGD